MTATLTINNAGQITLPETVQRLFKARPGESLQAEVSAERIEIIKEVPDVAATTRTAAGRLVLACDNIPVSTAQAVREARDALAGSAIRR